MTIKNLILKVTIHVLHKQEEKYSYQWHEHFLLTGNTRQLFRYKTKRNTIKRLTTKLQTYQA